MTGEAKHGGLRADILTHTDMPRACLAQVRMADLNFSNAPTVQGIGFRFVIPVPDLGSENQSHTVKDWKGIPQTVVGYKFQNATDGSDQAVEGNGQGIIIVGIDAEKQDGPAVAKNILAKVQELGGVESLNTAKLTALLGYIHDTLGIKDTYNSTDNTAKAMRPQAGLVGEGERPFGYFEKAEKPGPFAVYVSGAAEVLDGPHAGSAKYNSGFMAVRIPGKKEGDEPKYRSVAPEAIGYCYQLADGTKLTDPLKQLPRIEV
jgi:hypothetical protein